MMMIWEFRFVCSPTPDDSDGVGYGDDDDDDDDEIYDDNYDRDTSDDDMQPLFPIFPTFSIDLPDRRTDGQTQRNIEILRRI